MPDFGLSHRQLVILGYLAVIIAGTSIAQWMLTHRATRSVPSLLRPFKYGFGLWHVGMLRRSWYPEEGRHLHKWIVCFYVIQALASIMAFVLLVRWLIVM